MSRDGHSRALRPAVFLDRDGTLIEHVHYLRDPGDVRLIAGAADAVAQLRAAAYRVVVVTNQSAVGRGMLTEGMLAEIHRVMDRQLDAGGAALDGRYSCTVVPKQTDRSVVEHPDRKPGPGMLLRAARELSLDLAKSWIIGDSISDMLAGANAGCRGSILVRTGLGGGVDANDPAVTAEVADLAGAVELILAERVTAARP